MIYVLDTSAILSGKFFGGKIVTSPKILKEIKPKGHSWRLFEYMKSIGLELISPPLVDVKKVVEASKKTGDYHNLSDVDIDILALAYHLKGILLTDDYSMQNVAKELGIKYMGIVEEGIKEKWKWIYRCKSCGKYYKEYHKECPVCGGDLKRVRKR
ncbi:MAG: DNA-binding protein [Thermoplasmata archaeon]|nr:MAG: DNA-binding protein [Thermoplasmata archaeon]